MERDTYIERLKYLAVDKDREEAHQLADELLCEILEKHGYYEEVKIYKGMTRWYS